MKPAEEEEAFTIPEPLVACVKCKHFPCPFCGPTSCDEGVETSRKPKSAAEIEKWLARLELGNGMSEHALPSAREIERYCDGCGEKFRSEDAGARVCEKNIVFWFCTEACARKWCSEDDVEYGQCSCDGCVYEGDGPAQNRRVMDWFWATIGDRSPEEASVSTTKDGHLIVYLKKTKKEAKESP